MRITEAGVTQIKEAACCNILKMHILKFLPVAFAATAVICCVGGNYLTIYELKINVIAARSVFAFNANYSLTLCKL